MTFSDQEKTFPAVRCAYIRGFQQQPPDRVAEPSQIPQDVVETDGEMARDVLPEQH